MFVMLTARLRPRQVKLIQLDNLTMRRFVSNQLVVAPDLEPLIEMGRILALPAVVDITDLFPLFDSRDSSAFR